MDTPRPVAATLVSDLGEAGPAWDRLVDESPVPSPFLRSWWLRYTCTETGSYLAFHRTGEGLVGGLPIARDRHLGVPRIRFGGAGVLCPDHLDLLCRAGVENELKAPLMTWLTRHRNLIVDLSGLVQGSVLGRVLGRPVEAIDVAPYAALPVAPAEYLATRSSGTRRSARRSDRRLVEAGARHHRVPREGLATALADFRRLHEARPDRAPLLAELPRLARALDAGLAAGEARVDVLETGGRAQAVSLAFVVAGRLSLYQVARSLERADDGAGTVLLHRVVADAVAGGCHEVDFLRGDEGYKDSLADGRRSIGRIRFARGPLATGVLGVRSLAATAHRRAERSA